MEINVQEQFNYFTSQTGIEIPLNVLKIYSEGKNNNSNFIRLFKSHVEHLEKGILPELRILISEKFAFEILNLINRYPAYDRYNILFNSLELYDPIYEGKKMKEGLHTEKLLVELIFYLVNDYDYAKSSFKFPLIQEAYQNLDSNPEMMKVIFVLSGDCGGESGLIVRGKNLGYDTWYTHGESSEIEFNGQTYEYDGYLFENYERLHKLIIENFK